MNVIDQNILHESSNHHQAENYAILERNGVDIEDKYVELKKEIAKVSI